MNIILPKDALIRKAKETIQTHFAGVALHPEAMMVGGTIRDILLGRTPKDIDIATPNPAKLVADLVKAGYTHVLLDETRDIHRMVKDDAHIDITPLNENHINDLLSRDFTINSIGLILRNNDLLDPQGGVKDLSKGLVRALSQDRFIEDPLRLIRAFRIAADMNFTIDPVTLRFITKLSHLISKPSKERVRDEICWMMEADHSFQLVEELWRTGLLGKLFPEFAAVTSIIQNKPHALGLAEHLMWTYKYIEDIITELDDVLGQYADDARSVLSKVIASNRKTIIIVKLAALLHDIGKPATITYDEEVHFIGHDKLGAEMIEKRMAEFKFSSAETKAVSMLVENHMRPHNLLKLDEVSPRAVYRFFRDLDNLAIPSLLIGIADAYATEMLPLGSLENYHEFVRAMIDQSIKIGKPKPMLTGEEVMSILKIEPGPLVGQIIDAMLDGQATGEIKNKDQAKAFVKSWRPSDETNA
ncbi:MAG: HD domain-containing protein [Caldisericia bacterium]|nr:HD domain-containing protein [Caldisericia bacterium]